MALSETPITPEKTAPKRSLELRNNMHALFGKLKASVQTKVLEVKNSEKVSAAIATVKHNVNKEGLKKGLESTKNAAEKVYQKTYNALYGKLFGTKETTPVPPVIGTAPVVAATESSTPATTTLPPK